MRESQTFNVELPNGMILRDIPAGTTKEQIKQRLNAKGIDPDSTGEEKGFLDRVGEDLGRRADTAKQYAQELSLGQKSVPEFIGKTVANVGVGAVNDVIGEGIASATSMAPDFIKEPVKQGIKNLAESPVGEAVKSGVGKYQQFEKQNPRAAEWAAAFGNVASLPAIGKSAEVAGDIAGTGVLKAGDALYDSGKQAFEGKRLNFIQNLVSPKETPKVLEDQVRRTRMEGKFFKNKVVEPSTLEKDMARVVAETPVSARKTLQENYNILQDTVAKEADFLSSSLAANDVRFPRREFKAQFNNVLDNLSKSIMISGDAETVAQKIIDKMTSLVDEKPSTASNLLQARKELDQWVRSQKGAGAFDPIRENAISTALREVRQATNDFIAKKVESVPVKESLRKQSLLYSAMENLAPKAAGEAKTSIGRAAQRVYEAAPLKSDVGKLASGAILAGGGLGVASLLPGAAAAGATAYGATKLATSPTVRRAIGKGLQKTGNALKGNRK